MDRPAYRPIPGKFTVDASRNAIVRVERYGSDSGGEYVYVRGCGCGTYRPGYPLPLSCIRPLTDQDREDLSILCQQGFAAP